MATQSERRLWRIDLNDVHVQGVDGEPLEVVLATGVLDGQLVVTLKSCARCQRPLDSAGICWFHSP